MNDYTTTDIYLAATLSALGYALQEITQENNKFIFHFDAVSKLTAEPTISLDAGEYWTGDLQVNPKKLFSEFKEIKARMYDLRRSKNG